MKLKAIIRRTLKNFVAHRRIDVFPTMATRKNYFDMAVKWQLNLR
jgi:hypothetical protein